MEKLCINFLPTLNSERRCNISLNCGSLISSSDIITQKVGRPDSRQDLPKQVSIVHIIGGIQGDIMFKWKGIFFFGGM